MESDCCKVIFDAPKTLQGYGIHCKNICRFYGKIIGNQLPVHFPVIFKGARKHLQESGMVR